MPIFIEQAYDLPLPVILGAVFVASLFIGIGKAGFGGGVGLVSPPVFAQVIPMRVLLPLMQPLLMACDVVAIRMWWRKWDPRNVRLLLPGTVIGVAIGWALLTSLTDRHLKVGLGVIALSFVTLQILRRTRVLTGSPFRPVWWQGTLCGIAAGFCSILAHAAGAIIVLYLLPQRLGKEKFVATTVLYYACLNVIKVPFYVERGMLTVDVVVSALWLVPVVVLGAFLGVWMNRRVSENVFAWIVYTVVVITACKLLFG